MRVCVRLLADFSQMSYAAGAERGGGGDYYATAGLHDRSNDHVDHIPMRAPSAGSLHQAPLAPQDTMRGSMVGHPYASKPSRPYQGHMMEDEFVAHGDSGANNGGYDPYSTYAQDVVGQPPNYAGHGAAARARANPAQNDWAASGQQNNQVYSAQAHNQEHGVAVNQHLDGLGAAMLLEDDDPFAHSQDGHSQAAPSSASYYSNSRGQPSSAPRRSMSTKSRGMTFGHPEEDENYFVDHGPTNDDDSIVLGRTSNNFAADPRFDEGDFRAQRPSYGYAGNVNTQAGVRRNSSRRYAQVCC